MIAESSLSEKVKETGIKIFTKLAQAEAKVHGHGIDEVRFHEVGAVDSIVDIVGAAIGLELLNVEQGVGFPRAGGRRFCNVHPWVAARSSPGNGRNPEGNPDEARELFRSK